MKFKKIIAQCKQRKHISIVQCDERQWIGDGLALYAAHGLPKFNQANVGAAFDLTAKQENEEFYIQETTHEDVPNFLQDTDANDYSVNIIDVTFKYCGTEYRLFKAHDSYFAINNDNLETIGEIDEMEFYLRPKDENPNEPHLVVKLGMLLVASMLFIEIPEGLRDTLLIIAKSYKEVN